MTLWTLLQSAVLCMNAGAILNEERFLDKCAYAIPGHFYWVSLVPVLNTTPTGQGTAGTSLN